MSDNKNSIELIDFSVDNILFNMFFGLTPEHLSKGEVELLQNYFDKKYGENSDWFTILGYHEPEYKRSRFDKHVSKQTSIEHE